MKLGLFGGTFNPIHNGHIKVICHVKKKFRLNEIYLIPSAVPPHKPDFNLATAENRLEMVKCSIKDITGLTASDIEIRRQGPSFTIDTINQFRKILSCRQSGSRYSNLNNHSINHTDINNHNINYYNGHEADIDLFLDAPLTKSKILTRHDSTGHDPERQGQTIAGHAAEKTEFYLIMGSDAFFDIPTWKKNIEIFCLIPVIVMIRPGEKRNLNHLARFIKNMISDKYNYDEISESFLNPDMKTIYIHKGPEINLSSTLIRKRIKQHLRISSMVHPCVETIIIEKGLYL